MSSRKRQKSSQVPPDFKKKKKKVGKGKRPAENATDITFKSRAVFVPTQLEQTNTDEPTTHRKLGLQDLFAHITHYKSSVRKDALNGLHDLFQTNPDLITSNLTKLVSQVFTLIIDNTQSVRKALCTLLGSVFTNVSGEHLEPFFPILVAHISCGLTHIDDRIQVDTLKVFDLVLKHYPSLLVEHAQNVLPLLVCLVSRQKKLSQSRISTRGKSSIIELTKVGRGTSTLSGNPESKMAELSSRLHIFTLLSKFLEAVLSAYKKGADSNVVHSVPTVNVSKRTVYVCKRVSEMEELSSTLCDFTASIPHVRVLHKHGIVPPQNILTSESPQENGSIVLNDVGFFQTLISLCIETWVECCPSDVFAQYSTIPSRKQQVIPLMETILNLLCLILKLVQRVEQEQVDSSGLHSTGRRSLMELVAERNWSEFQTHFFAHFPFFTTASLTSDLPRYTMNFTLCHIVTLLVGIQYEPAATSTHIPLLMLAILKSVCSFMSSLVEIQMSMSSQEMLSCVEIVVELLAPLFASCERLGVTLEEQRKLCCGILSIYNRCHELSSSKRVMVTSFNALLENTLSKGAHMYMYSAPVLSDLLIPWLQSIPDLFVKLGDSSPETSTALIIAMATALRHTYVATPIILTLEHMIASLSSSHGVLSQLPPLTQRKAVELIWYAPMQSFSQPLLARLTECVNSGGLHVDASCYLVQTIHHKFTSQSPHSKISLYISFMISILVGYSHDELQTLKNSLETVMSFTKFPRPGDRMRLIEVVCDCLLATSFSHEVLFFVEPLLSSLCSSCQLPFDAVAGVLTLGCCFIPSSNDVIPDSLIQVFRQLCFTSLVTMETEDQPFLIECLKLTNQLCGLSQPISKAVLKEFEVSTTNADCNFIEVAVKHLDTTLKSLSSNEYTNIQDGRLNSLNDGTCLKTQLEQLLTRLLQP